MQIQINTKSVIAILAKKNIMIKDFASMVGVSRTAVSLWFNGRKCPSAESRKKIQHVLGKTRQWDSIFVIVDKNDEAESQ